MASTRVGMCNFCESITRGMAWTGGEGYLETKDCGRGVSRHEIPGRGRVDTWTRKILGAGMANVPREGMPEHKRSWGSRGHSLNANVLGWGVPGHERLWGRGEGRERGGD